tara:strand:+ start:1812 stop:2960 length:1149 start_codon:yes stop_codon:yes gene_type:complete
MALLIECPNCKNRNSLKKLICKCGKKIRKESNKCYWIEYYIDGQRKRERIGHSKLAAENRFREVQTAKVEGRYIKNVKGVKLTLNELRKWYLSLSEVRNLSTYNTLLSRVAHPVRLIGESKYASSLSLDDIEHYRLSRGKEESRWSKNNKVTAATINKEISAFKSMLNFAVKYGKIESNPIIKAAKLKDDNVRQRIISQNELENLLSFSPVHLKPILKMAYYEPMRKEEIIGLTWDEIDLQSNFIRLSANRTKGKKNGRSIPIHPLIKEMLYSLPRSITTNRVFLYLDKQGRYRPFKGFSRSWNRVRKLAGLNDVVFHDFRHTAITNMRKAGNPPSVIMKASGHKTMSMFLRYNLVDDEDLRSMKWNDESIEMGNRVRESEN